MRAAAPRIVVLLLSLTAGCADESEQPATGSAERPPPQVGVVTVRAEPFTLVNELPGRTAPYEIAEIRPRVTGIVQARLFTEGDRAEPGQPLYRIEDDRYRAALQRAKAEVELAEAALELASLRAARFEKLRQTDVLSRQNYDEAVAERGQAAARLAAARADVTAAEIDLDYTTIVAPIGGRIGRSLVTPGALVTANQDAVLATIRRLDPIYVDVTQSYDELKALRDAHSSGAMAAVAPSEAEVTLVFEGGGAYPRPGRLKFSEYAVNAATGSVMLRAVFPNPDHDLLPGMFVRARLAQAERDAAILVPQKAVSRDPAGRATALVVAADDTVERRTVRTVRAVDDRWLIAEGLAEGDRLIVDGLQRVRPGAKVRPTAVDAGPDDGARTDDPPAEG